VHKDKSKGLALEVVEAWGEGGQTEKNKKKQR
jgi:hypothetical protein